MIDYSDETFGSVEQIANGKGFSLVCNHGYYLVQDGENIFWSYFLQDVLNFLRNYKNA